MAQLYGIVSAEEHQRLYLRQTLVEMRSRGFPIVGMADLLRADRRTVYAWLEGSEEDHDASVRLTLIWPLLDAAFGSNFRTVWRLWRTKDRTGVTLGELLICDHVDQEAVRTYLATFSAAIARYARQDAAERPLSARGGNGLLDDMPTIDFRN